MICKFIFLDYVWFVLFEMKKQELFQCIFLSLHRGSKNLKIKKNAWKELGS